MSSASDPEYWRHFAPAGTWSRIDCGNERSVPARDRKELRSILETIVPRKELVDGLEEWELACSIEDIDETHEPDPMRRQELRHAAYLLSILIALIEPHDEDQAGGWPKILERAVREAKEILNESGISYSGWTKTYLWEDPGSGKLRSLSLKRSAVIVAARDATLTHDKKAWCTRYPWRRCERLSELWPEHPVFRKETGSERWHAFRILCLEDELDLVEAVARLDQPGRISTGTVKKLLFDVAQISLQIGLSHQSINKKSAEYDAVWLRKRDESAARQGHRGGQVIADKKLEAYRYLEKKAFETPRFIELGESERTSKTMKWARDRDRRHRLADKLFQRGGELLSKEWFEDWYYVFIGRQSPSKTK